MSVRNFYAKIKVDGRETNVGVGPRGKDGGMGIELYQRDYGEISHVLTIYCHFNSDGLLITEVVPSQVARQALESNSRYITER